MPFTPFHLGPAIFFGMLLRKHMHMPTFIVANVILDIEPLLVIIFGLKYPLHGYFHTFIMGFFIGSFLGLAMFMLERFLSHFYKTLLLESDVKPSLRQFVLAGSSGALLHILLDAPLYDDIRPLYPLTVNPFYNPSVTGGIYLFCIITGGVGVFLYACILIIPKVMKSLKKLK
ncbi:MAG: hydrolase [Thermoproteota archaeon]